MRRLQEMENSGNEAKKYLKAKDITFLRDANFAHFARNLSLKCTKSAAFQGNEPKFGSSGEADTVTISRLHKLVLSVRARRRLRTRSFVRLVETIPVYVHCLESTRRVLNKA